MPISALIFERTRKRRNEFQIAFKIGSDGIDVQHAQLGSRFATPLLIPNSLGGATSVGS